MAARRSSKRIYRKETVSNASSALRVLIDNPPGYNLKETIEALKPDIESAIDVGYSIEDIVTVLNKNGVKIRASTLNLYLRLAGKNKLTTNKHLPSSFPLSGVKSDSEISSNETAYPKEKAEIEESRLPSRKFVDMPEEL